MKKIIFFITFIIFSFSLLYAKPKVKIDPKIKYFIPGYRLKVSAYITDPKGIDVARVYFKESDVKNYNFVPMEKEKDKYVGILPAPSDEAKAIDFIILIKNGENKVFRTQAFRVEKEKGKKKLPAWQLKLKEGIIHVKTELAQIPEKIEGFSDNIVIDTVESAAKLGVVVGIISKAAALGGAGSAAGAGAGAAAGASAGGAVGGGAVAGGTIAASTGGIGLGTVAAVTAGVAAVGAGAAAAGSSGGGGGGGSDQQPPDKPKTQKPKTQVVKCQNIVKPGESRLYKDIKTYIFESNDKSFRLTYNFYVVPDQIKIKDVNNGQIIYDTTCKGTQNKDEYSNLIKPGKYEIIVIQNCAYQAVTKWVFKIDCE